MRTLLLFALLFPLAAMAQRDTTLAEQYCRVKTENILFSSKFSLEVDNGDEHILVRDAAGKPVRFNTVTDALNYMGKQGWLLVNVYTLTTTTTSNTWYLFKKLVKRT